MIKFDKIISYFLVAALLLSAMVFAVSAAAKTDGKINDGQGGDVILPPDDFDDDDHGGEITLPPDDFDDPTQSTEPSETAEPTESTDPSEDPDPTEDPDEPDPHLLDKFTDVHKTDWYYDAIYYMVAHGYMNGSSATTMEPEKELTRAEMIMVMYHMLDGKPVKAACPFTDVKPADWFYDPVVWAYSEGIASGTSLTTFEPDAPVTREQVARFMYNAFLDPNEPLPDKSFIYDFTDGKTVSGWAISAMDWAIYHHVIGGKLNSDGTTTLSPLDTATRAELAAMISRISLKTERSERE